jgi:hypothetical protein
MAPGPYSRVSYAIELIQLKVHSDATSWFDELYLESNARSARSSRGIRDGQLKTNQTGFLLGDTEGSGGVAGYAEKCCGSCTWTTCGGLM